MNFIKKHKILLIIIAIVLIIAIALGIYFCTKDTSTEVNSLKITYKDGDQITIKNPSGSYTMEKEITVTNPTKDLKTIKGEGDRAASLGKSQVPAADSKIFNSVAIQAGKTHIYKITITYNGKQVDSNSFTGTLKINSQKPKKDTKKEGIPYKNKEKQTTETKTKETKKNSSKEA